LHKLVASPLQVTENIRKGDDGLLVDVVKKQNSPALFFNPGDRALFDLSAAYPLPVVRRKVRAPRHQLARCERRFRRLGRQQTRYTKKRSHPVWITQGRGDSLDTFVNLCAGLGFVHSAEREGMVEAVRSNGVPRSLDLPGLFGKGFRHLADHKECRLDALVGKCRENAVRITRGWSVIKGQDHFVIGKRQRFRVLDRSDATMLQWVDGNNATDAKRVGFAIAV
jgi:hypothetical protein